MVRLFSFIKIWLFSHTIKILNIAKSHNLSWSKKKL